MGDAVVVGTRIRLLIDGRDESLAMIPPAENNLGSKLDAGASLSPPMLLPIGGKGGMEGAKKGSYAALGRPSITRDNSSKEQLFFLNRKDSHGYC